MSKVILLTGSPGAGKNTVGDLVSKSRPRCVPVDVDLLRYDMVRPHRPNSAEWEKDGKLAYPISAENACLVAQNLLKHDFDVILLDVLISENKKVYSEWKTKLRFKTVLLLPTWETIKKRTQTRSSEIKEERVRWLYDPQNVLDKYDCKIDNSKQSPRETATAVSEVFER